MTLIFKNTTSRRKLVIFVVDIIAICAACFLAYCIVLTLRDVSIKQWLYDLRFLRFTGIMTAALALLLYVFELYTIPGKLRKLYTLTAILVVHVLACAIFLLLGRIFDWYVHTKIVLAPFFCISVMLLFVSRLFFLEHVYVPQKNSVPIVFVGTDHLTTDIDEAICNTEYSTIGVLSHDEAAIGQSCPNGLKIVSTGKNLGNLIKSKNVKVMVLALHNEMPLELIKKINAYRLEGVAVYRSDTFYEIITRKFAIKQYLADKTIPFPDIDIFTDPIFKNTKRLVDFFSALLGLLLCAPLFLLLALLIKITSRGPVFFKQQRVGFQGREFNLFKFRTMIEHAERDTGPQWAQKSDPRVTPLGRILRTTRLDELPQLINVWRGDISFVGPRPVRKHFVEVIENEIPFYSIRFSIKPGITGWAQVNYDYGGTLEGHIEKFQYDLYYLKHASLFLDVFIVLKTAQTLLRHPAY